MNRKIETGDLDYRDAMMAWRVGALANSRSVVGDEEVGAKYPTEGEYNMGNGREVEDE